MAQGEIALGQGYYWQDMAVGQRFRTYRRTITEADLIGFIGVTGQTEVIFVDTTHSGAIAGRPVPGSLTYSLIEGMLFQTLIQRTGLAFLELHQKVHAPVRVGDTVEAVVEIEELRPTSKGNRCVMTSQVNVFNQDGVLVLDYQVKRLVAGRPEPV
jgi:acyl dehydratase